MDPITPTPSPTLPPLGSGIGAVETGPAAMPTVSAIPENIPQSPKRRFNFGMLGAIAALFVLLAGSGAAYFLTQQSQDLRNQASGQVCRYDSQYGCADQPVGSIVERNGLKYRCDAVNPTAQITVCSGVQTERWCPACSKWSPIDVNCTQACQGGSSTGGGEDPGEGSGGDDDEQIACGANGQQCCDPGSRSDGKICENNLFCVDAKCGTSAAGLCSEHDSTAGEFAQTCNLYVCDKCSMYGGNAECRTFKASGNCSEMQAQLDAEQCGQVDFMQANDMYCGVKSIKCGGACAPSEPPTNPSGAQCKEIVGIMGTPGGTRAQVAPRIGDSFYLKCRKVAGASSYRFRYFYTKRRGAAGYAKMLPGTGIKVGRSEQIHISDFINIDKVGLYYGQCKVCMPDGSSPSGEKCGAWESVSGDTKMLPQQAPVAEPTDPGYTPTDPDVDDGLPNGVPAARPVFEQPEPRGTPVPESQGPGTGAGNVIDPIIGNPTATE